MLSPRKSASWELGNWPLQVTFCNNKSLYDQHKSWIWSRAIQDPANLTSRGCLHFVFPDSDRPLPSRISPLSSKRKGSGFFSWSDTDLKRPFLGFSNIKIAKGNRGWTQTSNIRFSHFFAIFAAKCTTQLTCPKFQTKISRRWNNIFFWIQK